MTQAQISEKPGPPRGEFLNTDPVERRGVEQGRRSTAEIGRWAGWEECQPLVVPGEPEGWAARPGRRCAQRALALLRISLKAAAVSAPLK